MRHIDKHCTVAAEDGVVVLECGHALVTLEPRVAKVAANRLAWMAGVADGQGALPASENESGEGK